MLDGEKKMKAGMKPMTFEEMRKRGMADDEASGKKGNPGPKSPMASKGRKRGKKS